VDLSQGLGQLNSSSSRHFRTFTFRGVLFKFFSRLENTYFYISYW